MTTDRTERDVRTDQGVRAIGDTTLTALLARIAAEIGVSADGIDALQTQISPHLDVLTEQVDFAVIQNIDRIEQTLRDLRCVLHDLAAMPQSAAVAIDAGAATAGCKLDDVSRRLQALPPSGPGEDLDLF